MAGLPNSLNLQPTNFTRRGASSQTSINRNLPDFLKKPPIPPTEDEINNLRENPIIDNQSLRDTPPQKPGYQYGERIDPDLGNSTKTTEEYVRRLLLKYKNPLYQLLGSVCASAGVRDPDDYTEKSSSLLIDGYRLQPGTVDPFDASLSRQDVYQPVDKDRLDTILKLARDRPEIASATIKQLFDILPKNQSIDVNYTSSWENLGILRFNQAFIYALESAILDLKTKYPNGKWTLGKIVLTKESSVFLQFSNLCAYYINLPKTTAFNRPITQNDVHLLELKRQRALDFFMNVEYVSNDYRIVTSKPAKKTTLIDINDIYDKMLD